MKKITGFIVAVFIAAGVMTGAGCGKKAEEKKAADPKARELMVAGTGYLKQGEVIKAVQSFAMAMKIAPDEFESYYMLGETFIHLKQFPQAQSVLTAAVNRFPENPIAYYLLSMAYEGAGNTMPAIVAARKSVDLFQARRDQEGLKRATILLGALVQAAKLKAEASIVDNAAKDAVTAGAGAVPAAAR